MDTLQQHQDDKLEGIARMLDDPVSRQAANWQYCKAKYWEYRYTFQVCTKHIGICKRYRMDK